MTVKVGITLHDVQHFFGGDPASLIRVAKMADDAGIDHIILGDHLLMTEEGAQKYPSGVPVPFDYEQYEPLILHAAVAAVTSRIRLSTGILIGPLRPAILLAKQVATLDQLSGGRVDLGIGVGWQQEEYEAAGIPFEGRFGRLEEQIQACRSLWGQKPASFSGKTVHFDKAYASPRPAQGAELPIWLGFSLTDRNIERVARLGQGWIATTSREHDDDLAENIARLRTAFAAHGRDPASLEVCLTPTPVRAPDGRFDLEATMAGAERQIAAGVTILVYRPSQFCRDESEISAFMDRLIGLKKAYQNV